MPFLPDSKAENLKMLKGSFSFCLWSWPSTFFFHGLLQCFTVIVSQRQLSLWSDQHISACVHCQYLWCFICSKDWATDSHQEQLPLYVYKDMFNSESYHWDHHFIFSSIFLAFFPFFNDTCINVMPDVLFPCTLSLVTNLWPTDQSLTFYPFSRPSSLEWNGLEWASCTMDGWISYLTYTQYSFVHLFMHSFELKILKWMTDIEYTPDLRNFGLDKDSS